MQIELKGAVVELRGSRNEIADAALHALAANGAEIAAGASAQLPDILIAVLPLLPADGVDAAPLLAIARSTGDAMFARGSGRILFVLSAAAGMPMRRHPDYSVQVAAALAGMRALAMALGPRVLVNAVGVGVVGEPAISGDVAMLGHASVKRSGTVAEVVDTVLFFCDPLNTYTTGQMLSVDGGWSAGYGRSF
ncbi:MAG: SDR family oxidoreductase [Devosia nanyangense]|uniref:SDR family oxidoreductase n=1 Tax=Devosia nanyangense TaxID=1228055 RepID=A0A933P0R6_9HYPH|nr:SDR family oxidoreductase [Devosia nanyangense]